MFDLNRYYKLQLLYWLGAGIILVFVGYFAGSAFKKEPPQLPRGVHYLGQLDGKNHEVHLYKFEYEFDNSICFITHSYKGDNITCVNK